MKDKIIIHNYTDLTDLDILKYITKVVEVGFLSETSANGKQYCFITTFKSGYTVNCDKKRNTYTFKVVKEKLNGN